MSRSNYKSGRNVKIKEVESAMKALKEGEASGVGGFTSEMIKIRGDCVLEWL